MANEIVESGIIRLDDIEFAWRLDNHDMVTVEHHTVGDLGRKETQKGGSPPEMIAKMLASELKSGMT